jgi:hypothetical protein
MTTISSRRQLSDEQFARYWEDGLLVIQNVLDEPTIDLAKQAIVDLIPRDFIFGENFHSHSGRLKPLNALRGDGRSL